VFPEPVCEEGVQSDTGPHHPSPTLLLDPSGRKLTEVGVIVHLESVSDADGDGEGDPARAVVAGVELVSDQQDQTGQVDARQPPDLIDERRSELSPPCRCPGPAVRMAGRGLGDEPGRDQTDCQYQ
jgi:hypothetical protein